MKNFKLKLIDVIFNFIFLIFFIGCAVKTTPVYLHIDSPEIKLSDEGFLKESLGYKQIIIYKAGNEPVNFILKENKICVENRCFNKEIFIKKYFNGYQKDFFDRILNKKPLALNNFQKIQNGFIQKEKGIFYKVTNNYILFKDKKRKTIVLIKYLKGKK